MSGYTARVYVDANDMVGLEHDLFASEPAHARSAGWLWLDVIGAGGRVVVIGPSGVVGTWVYYGGRDVWTGTP